MKLSQKQIELMAEEIAIEASHFEIFDKSVFMENIGLTFNPVSYTHLTLPTIYSV